MNINLEAIKSRNCWFKVRIIDILGIYNVSKCDLMESCVSVLLI
jgi:hypothetical protein